MADLSASVHAAITLAAAPQTITTAITSPAVPRCLSITGTKAGSTLTGNVVITGTDEDGVACSATIALEDNETIFDYWQLFSTVTQIVVPVQVTTGDTVKIGFVDKLFDIPTARAFHNAGLMASASEYPSSAILDAEFEIREWLESPMVCNVAFFPRFAKNEAHNGDGSNSILLRQPLPLLVTAASIDGTVFEAAQLDPADYTSGIGLSDSGLLERRYGIWNAGVKNCLVSYWNGYNSTPALVRKAALEILVTEMPKQASPYSADRSDIGGDTVISFAAGDGFRGSWHRIPDVRRIVRMYGKHRMGVA
jgi:hypothetical protein